MFGRFSPSKREKYLLHAFTQHSKHPSNIHSLLPTFMPLFIIFIIFFSLYKSLNPILFYQEIIKKTRLFLSKR